MFYYEAMYIRTALDFYGTRAAVAKALGYTRQAVYAWERRSDLVPELCAIRLSRASAGNLRYDPALYHETVPAVKSSRSLRRSTQVDKSYPT
jgi:DNA-binding XRE family transcriptional regulator